MVPAAGAVVDIPRSRKRAAVRRRVNVSAVVHINGVPVTAAARPFLDHAPEVFLDFGKRRLLVAARGGVSVFGKEPFVELSARRFKLIHGERLAGVEPQVIGVGREGDAVGAEPVPSGD